MSVAAGRIYVLVCTLAFLICGVWLTLALISVDGEYRKLDAISGLPATVGFIAAVGLGMGATLFARFAEVSIEPENLRDSGAEPRREMVVRKVLAARKSVPLRQIDRAIIVKNLVLPSYRGPSRTVRAVIWTTAGRRMAFSPNSFDLGQQLEACGVTVETVSTALTARQAAGRYPVSVSIWERAVSFMPWAAIAIAIAVLIWVVYEAM